MGPAEVEAIVLNKLPYGDGDLILTALTAEGSRITLFAKQGLASQRRFGPTLDFGNTLHLEFHSKPAASLKRLNRAELLSGVPGIRNDLTRYALASYFAEIILHFLPADESLPAVYQTFTSHLRALDNTVTVPGHWIPMMEYAYLSLFGFQPVLDRCLSCDGGIEEARQYQFHGGRGGVICGICAQQEPTKLAMPLNGNAYPMSYTAIHHLMGALTQRPLQYERVAPWGEGEVAQVRRAFEYFIQYTAGKPLRSLQFLSQVNPIKAAGS